MNNELLEIVVIDISEIFNPVSVKPNNTCVPNCCSCITQEDPKTNP